MKNNQYEVQVLVGGRRIKEYQKYVDGEYRTFVEGRSGSEYEIRIKNNSNQKILAISTVDGLSVVSGELIKPTGGRGYIIGPHDSVTIKGFRESDNTVGTFKFTSKNRSYAAEKGLERNVGIIAVNILAEKIQPSLSINNDPPEPIRIPAPWGEPPVPWRPKKYPPYYCGDDTLIRAGTAAGDVTFNCLTQNDSGSAPRVAANFTASNSNDGLMRKADFSLGTGWGTRVNDSITRKHFEKGAILASFKIYYSTCQGLENMGVKIHPKKQIDDWPQGFENDYAKPPKTWRG